MRHLVRFLVPLVLLFATGCGGASAGNLVGSVASVVVTLDSTTSNLNNLHLIVAPLDGAADSPEAASDVLVPSWAQVTITPLQKRIAFTTALDRVPYRVWVKNLTAAEKGTKLRITIEGNVQHDENLVLAASEVRSPVRVLSNSVEQLP